MYMSFSRSVIVRYPAGVEAADVAGVQPAVGVDGLGRRDRIVEVAEHQVRPAQQDLAGLAGPAAGPPSAPATRTENPAAARPQVRATVSGASPGTHMVATTASVSP